jgi:hypothetical protein
LKLQLRLHARDQSLVANSEIARCGTAGGIGKAGELFVSKGVKRLWLGGVVPVNVDDHRRSSPCYPASVWRARDLQTPVSGCLRRRRAAREQLSRVFLMETAMAINPRIAKAMEFGD